MMLYIEQGPKGPTKYQIFNGPEDYWYVDLQIYFSFVFNFIIDEYLWPLIRQ